MYGNVDAAMQWMKLFTKCITTDIRNVMYQSIVDPCMFYRNNTKGTIELIVIIYVDDMIVCCNM